MRRAKVLMGRVTVLIFTMYSFVGISAHISAAVDVIKYTHNGKFVKGITCHDIIPFNFYIPFDTSTPTMCQYALFYMDIGLDAQAFYIASTYKQNEDNVTDFLIVSVKSTGRLL